MKNQTAKKIFTLRDARMEKINNDARRELREARRAASGKARKPHLSGDQLPASIGALARWDSNGNPFYYIVRDGAAIESTDIEYLARIS